ncbi:MAG: guanylate kinase [Lachnospiraceae bacterium]|jgi:guanylate kinase|nr:guanylate kinase [Lachnospiraceae bacterium]
MVLEKKGILIVVSGFSGAGKGTIMKELLKRHPNVYALSISATTRKPRVGEQDGVDYFFKTKEEFEQMIENGDLIEYAQYVGNYYGTPKPYVDKQLEAGKDVILEIEIQGAFEVKEKFPQTVLLFVTPPSAQILEKRLVGRGTEDRKTIAQRLSRAAEEVEKMDHYDYLIINDDLEKCVKKVHQILRDEHLRISRNQAAINQIRQELQEFSKGEYGI